MTEKELLKYEKTLDSAPRAPLRVYLGAGVIKKHQPAETDLYAAYTQGGANHG